MLSWKTITPTHRRSMLFTFENPTGCFKRSTSRTAMNLRHAATHIPLSRDQHTEAKTRLHGRRLLLARMIWLTLVVLTLSVYLASLPAYFSELHTVCRLAVCSYGQLSPDTVVTLEHFGLPVGSYTTFIVVLATLVALTFFGTAGVIFWRKSDDWMALLMALGLVLGGTIPVLLTVGTGHSTWQVPILLVSEMGFLVFFFAFTLFPDGRLVLRWTRWLLVAFSIDSVVFVVFTNPLTTTAPPWIVVPLDLLFFALYAGLIIAQMYRYRYVSTLVQRQQTKWVVFGLAVNIVVSIAVLLPALIFPKSLASLLFTLVYFCALFLYPSTIGIATLRYRLWDIDVLINRTLIYGTLTVMLALVYFGLVIGLQALLRGIIGQDSSVAIVISTLAIAALFQPLRSHLQKIIDRRFYRSKYNAAKIIEAFSATLRNQVDLTTLSEQLVEVVQETMQPAHVSLWLRPPGQSRERNTRVLPRIKEEESIVP